MPLGVEETAALVRATARVSALVFAASLAAAARRLAAGADIRAARRADIAAFAAFLGAHTIHFATVLMLAGATSGENIRHAGGWIPTLAAAGAFYASCAAVLRGRLRQTARWATAGARRLDVATMAILWLVFFQAYALRLFQSAWFAALAVVLAASLALFAAAARPRQPQAERAML
jgi:hypothetical protein